MGRFSSADTIVPGGVQGYDQYAYSNNSPVVYVDPSGHAPSCNGLSGYQCEIRQRKWREANHVGEYAYGEEDDGYSNETLDMYTMAGLAMESPYFGLNLRPRFWVLLATFFWDKDYRNRSIGIAAISDAEMSGPYGEELGNGDRGIGLGLRNGACTISGCDIDQNDPDTAYLAMKTRIRIRLDACVDNGCTDTDMFFVAMLAADEQITPNRITELFTLPKYKIYRTGNPSSATAINWGAYLHDNHRAKASTYLNLFASGVLNSGYPIPTLDWNYINGLRAAY